MKLTPEQFREFASKISPYLVKHKTYRAGQGMFNLLSEIAPDVAESVRSTENDPFYQNSRIGNFFRAILNESELRHVDPRFLQ